MTNPANIRVLCRLVTLRRAEGVDYGLNSGLKSDPADPPLIHPKVARVDHFYLPEYRGKTALYLLLILQILQICIYTPIRESDVLLLTHHRFCI